MKRAYHPNLAGAGTCGQRGGYSGNNAVLAGSGNPKARAEAGGGALKISGAGGSVVGHVKPNGTTVGSDEYLTVF